MIILYLRTRRFGFAIAGLTLVALLAWLSVEVSFQAGPAIVRAALIVPLVSSTVIGVSVESPFDELEGQISYPIGQLKSIQIGSLFLWAAIALYCALLRWDWDEKELTIIRNLSGFTGLALIGSAIFGGRLSWIVPFSFTVLVIAGGSSGSNNQAEWARWAWPMHAGNDASSLAISLFLLAAGLLASILRLGKA